MIKVKIIQSEYVRVKEENSSSYKILGGLIALEYSINHFIEKEGILVIKDIKITSNNRIDSSFKGSKTQVDNHLEYFASIIYEV